jgi:hypothetical protein
MDLVTLIAACALSVGPTSLPSAPDPKVMHALIWEQSGGEPWSFSVPGENLPRVLPTIKDAIREARATRHNGSRIRVGLTGLSTHPRSVAAMTFVPCANITMAVRQLAQLVERCKTTSKPDPIYCAIAAYRGSWHRPDTRFAEAVRTTVEKGNAPNLDMPKDAYFDGSDIASNTPMPGPDDHVEAPEQTRDDRVRGWSSALFPAKPTKPDSTSADTQNDDQAPDETRSTAPAAARPARSKLPVDNLSVPRSSEQRP